MVMRISFLFVLFSLASCQFKPYKGNDHFYPNAMLPLDEAPHLKNSLEWWYFTGHLEDSMGSTYGIEYVFFHFNPEGKKDFIMVNLAMTDLANEAFYYDYVILKQDSFLLPELPINLKAEKGGFHSHFTGQMGNYTLEGRMDQHPIGMLLKTIPTKPVLLHSGTGYENYGDVAEAGYYSYPRMAAEGFITMGSDTIPVTGSLWYDRQWNCISVMEKDLAWDWIAIQFDNDEELMVYMITLGEENRVILGGTHYSSDLEATYLNSDQIEIEELEFWTSPDSGSKYPIRWNVSIPELAYQLEVKALMPDQELKIKLTPIHKLYYWEGKSAVTGNKHDEAVTGNAYVEITNRKSGK